MIDVPFDGDVFVQVVGFEKPPGWAARKVFAQIFEKAGLDTGEAWRALESGRPVTLPTRMTQADAEKLVNVLHKVYKTNARMVTKSSPLSLDLAGVSAALASERRSEVLPDLLEAAQWNPDAVDILIEDAITREDLVQADYWQSKKQSILSARSQANRESQGRRGSSTWTGMGFEMPLDGGI